MSNVIFDAILPWIREAKVWIPLYLFIITFCLFNFRKKGYFIIVFLALATGSADFISNTGFKKNIERVRPCRALDNTEVVTRVRCGSGFSFTSNHAANHFTISFFLIFLIGPKYRSLRFILFMWAFLVALAQVYVGVHYPLDVICGAILGICIAYAWSIAYTKFKE